MPLIAAYHRPRAIDDALSLLADRRRRPIGGGTTITADREPSDLEVVDLQALGLDGIQQAEDTVLLGATATLAAVATHAEVPEAVRTLARAEAPSTIRTLATVGGSVGAADADSMFVAALLAHRAEVRLAGADDRPLVDLLSEGMPTGSIVTGVEIEPGGVTTYATTGRTPADTPIVGAVGRATGDQVTLALVGVAATPVLVLADAPTEKLTPPDDFRGSATYRTELATVLARRVVEALR